MTVTEYITFTLADLTFGIEVHRVQEVVRGQTLTDVPRAHPVVAGLINLRGQIVTALDLRRRLALPDRPAGTAAMNVVLRTNDGTLSLLVDEIGDVVEVGEDSFETPPVTVTGVIRQLLLGAHKLDDRLLLILDVDRTVRLPEPA